MGTMEDAFRKAGVAAPAAEPLPEKPCARCGKNYRPARPQHKMCDECAAAMRAERETGKGAPRPAAAGGDAEKPEGTPESASAAAAARPRPDRPPRRDRPQGPRPERGERPERPERGERPERPDRFAGGERRPAPRGLPGSYLQGGYFADGGALKPELYGDWAEQVAQGVAAGPTDSTFHQLRLFQNHLRRAVSALKQGGRPVALVLNEVQKMKPYAAERAARRRISDHFRQFVEVNVDRVTDERSLLAFAEHFNAVASYADGLLHRKERR